MADPFIGEIRMVGFNFAPTGWAMCNGQLMPLSQNTALFSLLGTMYGGDGKTTFALPDLQGSAPMHRGQGPGLSDRIQGETGGSSTVTLLQSEMPLHTHTARANNAQGNLQDPGGNGWGVAPSGLRTVANAYAAENPNTPMSPQALAIAGGSVPHNNMQPYLVLNFIIALQGVYPSRP